MPRRILTVLAVLSLIHLASPAAVQAAAVSKPGASPGATLYEEQAGGPARETSAPIDWVFVVDGPRGAEIVANIDFNKLLFKARVTIYRNDDPSLPASHLIEIFTMNSFGVPVPRVSHVPGVLALDTTQERLARPLVGASVRFGEGSFLFALSNEASDRSRNIALLRFGDQIDITLVYPAGERAVLSLKKGAKGKEVFEKVFALWDAKGQ